MIFEITTLEHIPEEETDNYTILDVRSYKEYHVSRLPGAIHIDIMSNNSIERLSLLDKKKSYLVYCTIGVRSRSAVRLMDQMGFEHLYHLSNGIAHYDGELERAG